ncbi:MAG: substrate-binding domain-containing protein [Clostridiaceae bacterium]
MWIPDSFSVPVRYVEEEILTIEKTIAVQAHKRGKEHKNKLANRQNVAIGVSFPAVGVGRWLRDKEAMEARAKEKGVTLKIEINEFDVIKQALQVEKLISQGINVLIVVPIDPVSPASFIEKAHKAGIKVISYDDLAQNTDLELYMAFSWTRIGEIQGLYLVTKVPRGNYIIMSGDPGIEFKEGAMEYIQPLANIGNVKIVTDKVIKGWDPKIAYGIVKDSLIANKNNINAILAPNDETAGAAIEALQEQGLAGKAAVTGQDADLAAIRRIIQGTQSMTVLKDTRELGKRAVDAAINLAEGGPVDTNSKVNNGKMNVPSILLEPVLVDKNNIDSVIIGRGYYTKEQVYGRKSR